MKEEKKREKKIQYNEKNIRNGDGQKKRKYNIMKKKTHGMVLGIR